MANGLKTANIIDPNDDTRFVAVDPYVIEGVAKARANIGGGTFGTFDSTNVSSTTDVGIGKKGFTYTNNFKTNQYSLVHGGEPFSAVAISIYLENGFISSSGGQLSMYDYGTSFKEINQISFHAMGLLA